MKLFKDFFISLKLVTKKMKYLKIKEFSCFWAILQSIKYIASNNIEGDFVEAGVFKGLIL